MSTATVRSVTEKFLKTPSTEVLALKGAWGVGKTYAWNKLVRDLRKVIKPEKYSYVSLFGISSMQELRLAIFAMTVPIDQIGENATSESITKDWRRRALAFGQTLTNAIPYGKQVSVGLELLAPLLIRNTLICLDDLERLSAGVPVDELLGLVSSLKEERGCKIVLIFNDQQLGEKGDASYKKYREKIVDIELLFSPTAEEAAALVFEAGSPWHDHVRSRAVSLNIKNIRLLRKIDKLVSMVHAEMRGLHEKVLEQAIHTIVLIAWCFYEPDKKKPSMDFLRKFNSFARAYERIAREHKGDTQKSLAELQEHEWAKTMDEYGFRNMDEFDLSIIKVVEQGFIEESGLVEWANEKDKQHRAQELERAFSSAWDLFHNTFDNNEPQLVAALCESFKKSAKYITPVNASGTATLLRELGHDAIADELIELYMHVRSGDAEIFEMSDNHPFWSHITDPQLRRKMDEKRRLANPIPPLELAAETLGAGSGWNDSDMHALDQASADDFYKLFKKDHGRKLHFIVKGCLRAGQVAGHEGVGKRAREALARIAAESKINAIRVKRYPASDTEGA